MLLVFRHMGFDFGKFPHLMPQRLRVCAGELLAATSALLGFQRLDIVTLFGRQECSLVLGVPWLPTALFPGLRLAGRGFCVGMLSAGRQRRVLRCLVEPRFQFLNLCQQNTDDCLGLRRLPCNQFFRDFDFQRHALYVAKIAFRDQISFTKILPRRVNRYNPHPRPATDRPGGAALAAPAVSGGDAAGQGAMCFRDRRGGPRTIYNYP